MLMVGCLGFWEESSNKGLRLMKLLCFDCYIETYVLGIDYKGIICEKSELKTGLRVQNRNGKIDVIAGFLGRNREGRLAPLSALSAGLNKICPSRQ